MKSILSWLPLIALAAIVAVVLLLSFSSNEKVASFPHYAQAEPTEARRQVTVSVFGWTGFWDEDRSLKNLETAVQFLDGFSPGFYHITPEGKLGQQPVVHRELMFDLARSRGLSITPVIGDDFDFARVDRLLYDETIQQAFIEQLVEEAEAEGFDGWDINIESVTKEDRDAFSTFIRRAAQVLHEHELTLAVTVFARNKQETFTSALAHDYQVLGQAADRVQMMLYLYHNDDTVPGAQAPLDWYREVLAYALDWIPKDKIVIGISSHGFDWSEESVESLTFPEIQERIAQVNTLVTYTPDGSSAVAEYNRGGISHELWFEDTKTIMKKVSVAIEEFGLGKFIIWRVGAEDPGLWEKIKSVREDQEVL